MIFELPEPVESEKFLWVEKYRPKTLEECILPARIKDQLAIGIQKNNIQNMLFSGFQGSGKTTVAKALARDLNADILTINASEERNIDTLRGKVTQFVTSASTKGTAKIVLLDEADYLNAQSTQPALRNFIEEYSDYSRFILTCNYPDKILDALKSRLAQYNFNLTKEEKKECLKQWDGRVKYILSNEGIEYINEVLIQVVGRYFPDYRKTLNELQKFSTSGKLDNSILAHLGTTEFSGLVNILKAKNFSMVVDWLMEHPNTSIVDIGSYLFKNRETIFKKEARPQFVLLYNRYDFQAAQCKDQTINTLAFLTDVMIEVME